MRKALTVARITLRMLLRHSGGFILLGLISAVAVFIFAICSADDILTHELQIRTRYALTFSTTLLGMCVLWISCVSMRGDIEAKRLHLLTSYPLKRSQIYAGKWLGIVFFGLIGSLTTLITVGVCCWVMLSSWDNPEEVADLKASSWRAWQEVMPVTPTFEDEVERRFQDLQDQRGIPEGMTEQQVRERFLQAVRTEQQVVEPGGSKSWMFDIGPVPRHGDGVRLDYRFYSSNRKQMVDATWTISSPTVAVSHTVETTNAPFSSKSFVVPFDVIPEDGRFMVTFQGAENTPELLFYRNAGLKAYYLDAPLWSNAARFLASQVAHHGALAAVGLTIGTVFTISVASFVSIVLYFLAYSSSFFLNSLREIGQQGESTMVDQIFIVVVRLGTFFATGLEPPSSVNALSESLAIGLDNAGMGMTRWFGSIIVTPLQVIHEGFATSIVQSGGDLVIGFLFYFVVAVAGGMFLLKRKELDRVH